MIQIVGVQRLELVDARRPQLRQQVFRDLVVGACDQFARSLVDDIVRQHTADDEFRRYGPFLDACRIQFADVLGGDALVLGDDDVVVLATDVEARDFAAQTLGHQLELDTLAVDVERILAEECVQNGFGRIAQRLEQDTDRHLATAVDTEEQDVLGVEFEIQPGAAIGNHARREQQLARAVCLAAVVLEEHAGRTVQLRDDDPLGTVDDERSGGSHERDLAHVDFLLLHFLDGGFTGLAIEQDQAHLGAQGRCEGQPALLAFAHVEGGFAQHVADEFQPGHLVMADDGKNRGECGLQPFFLALQRCGIRLQEGTIGLELSCQQERNGLHVLALGEALADALLFGERVGHEHSDSGCTNHG